jgi:hypothetical protein
MLPRKDGDFGGISFDSSLFDRSAMRAMIQVIRQQPLFSRMFFNDPQLISEGLCVEVPGHHDHGHFEVKPPQPV